MFIIANEMVRARNFGFLLKYCWQLYEIKDDSGYFDHAS